MSGHVHRDVAKVAREAAAELYEVLMANNEVRRAWKQQNPDCSERELLRRFVLKNWGACIPMARATMALLLRDGHIADSLKESILEALVLDATLMHGRRENAPQVVGTLKRGG